MTSEQKHAALQRLRARYGEDNINMLSRRAGITLLELPASIIDPLAAGWLRRLYLSHLGELPESV